MTERVLPVGIGRMKQTLAEHHAVMYDIRDQGVLKQRTFASQSATTFYSNSSTSVHFDLSTKNPLLATILCRPS